MHKGQIKDDLWDEISQDLPVSKIQRKKLNQRTGPIATYESDEKAIVLQ